MLLACRLKITFTFSLELIISFLVQLQHLLLPSIIVTSSQVRVGMPRPLWSCSISGLGPKGLRHNRAIPCSPPVWSPGNLLRVTLASRGISASKNLQQETQQPKSCVYKTLYVAEPVRETGDFIARTPLYMWLPSDAPTRTRFFFGSRVTRFSGDPSQSSTGSYILFCSRKPHARAVPSMNYSMHMKP